MLCLSKLDQKQPGVSGCSGSKGAQDGRAGPDHYITEPYQPNPKEIAVQKLANRTLHFQEKWFKEFPWIRYCHSVNGVLCFYCVKAFQLDKTSLAKNTDSAFVSAGFRNWKKAVEKFTDHTKASLISLQLLHIDKKQIQLILSFLVHWQHHSKRQGHA